MRISLFCVFAFFILASTVAYGQKVKVDFDRSIDFSKYKTFAWADGSPARNPFISDMITSALETELASRGLVKNADAPDLKIAVIAAIGMDVQGIGPSWNNETYRFYGGRGNPSALMNIATGTLIVDLVDTKAGRNVWRGTASDTLPHAPTADPAADAKDSERVVRNAIRKMMKKYPAKQVR